MIKNAQKIKVILFDFMGVLLFPKIDYQPNELIDEIDRAIGQVINDTVFKTETIKNYHLDEAGFNLILDKIVDKYEPLEPLWNLLPEIRKKYKLAIINNGTSLTLPKFKNKYHLDSVFDLFISSAIEAIKKPDKGIYELTMSRLGVKPEECLFMDDSPANINAANKLGLATIYWETSKIGLKQFREFISR